jgi:hypothetical protein
MWRRASSDEDRDPSAPVAQMLVANLGFEFMVCRSKNVLYNSVNAFYKLGNNYKINHNSVIMWSIIFARVYGFRPSSLLQHTCIQLIKYTTYVCVFK